MKEKTEQKPIHKRKSFWVSLGVVLVVISLVLAVTLDYNLICVLLKIGCSLGKTSTPDGYQEILEKTDAKYDISYDSAYDNGYFDVYYPKNFTGPIPLFLYIHGGYYVGWDKSGVEPYCRIIASEGYVVVSMNYALAPKYKYPTQITQVNEILGYLTQNADEYGIDYTQIFIGGDSAGCHLTAQTGAFLTNDELAQTMGIERKIDGNYVKGLVLVSGFYNMDNIRETRFPFIDTAIWSLTGERNFENYPRIDELNVIKHVSENYPAVFITCGSDDLFLGQSQELATVLKNYEVSVTEYLPIADENELGHEFARDFSLKEANVAMQMTISFIKQRTTFAE